MRFSRIGRCYRALLGNAYFCIEDPNKGKESEKRFYNDVTNKMKGDMGEAIGRLIKNNTGYKFSYKSSTSHHTVVDGKWQGSREGFSRDLSLRIDIQGYFEREFYKKTREFANVQVQLNGKTGHTTIAQVNFECGYEIPAECIRDAFNDSCKEQKILFVVRRDCKIC